MEQSDSFDDLTKSVIELCDGESNGESVATDTDKGPSSSTADKSISLSPIKEIDMNLWNSAIASSQKFSWSCSTPLLDCGLQSTRWPHSQRSGSDANNGGLVKRSILPKASTPLLSSEFTETRKRKCEDGIKSEIVNKKVNATCTMNIDCNPETGRQSIDNLLDNVSVLCDDQTMVTMDVCDNKSSDLEHTLHESTGNKHDSDARNHSMVTLDICHGDSTNTLQSTLSSKKEVKNDFVNIGHISTIDIEEVVSKIQDLSQNSDLSAEKDIVYKISPNKTEGRFKGLDSTRLMSVTEAPEDEDLHVSDNDDILGLDELTYMDDSDDSEIDETILYEDDVNNTVVNVVAKEYNSVLSEKLRVSGFSDPVSILKDEDWVDFKRSEVSESNQDNICENGETKTDQGTMLQNNEIERLSASVSSEYAYDTVVLEKTAYDASTNSDNHTEKVKLFDNLSAVFIEEGININNEQCNIKSVTESDILQHTKSTVCDDVKNADLKDENKDSKLLVDETKELPSENVTSPSIATVEPYIRNEVETSNSPKLTTESATSTHVLQLTPKSMSTFKEENNSRSLTAPLASPSHKSSVEPTLTTVEPKLDPHPPEVSRDKSADLAAKRKCFQNENSLMQIVMKKWGSSGIQSQDMNLTCALSHRTKHANEPGVLEDDHISLLLDRQHGKRETMANTLDNQVNSFAQVFLDDMRSKFKIFLQKSKETIQNLKNECKQKRYEQEQKNRECIRELLMLQNLEFRHFRIAEAHLCQYNPSLAQCRVMQLTYEHNRQVSKVQQQCLEKIKSLESCYNGKMDKENEKISEDKTHMQAIIEQLDSDEGSQKLTKLGPHISVKLSKAPHKANPNQSIVTVCLPAKVASVIMDEDELFDTYYKY